MKFGNYVSTDIDLLLFLFSIQNFRNKSFERSIKHWTGQSWGDDIGLATPNG